MQPGGCWSQFITLIFLFTSAYAAGGYFLLVQKVTKEHAGAP